MAGRFYKRSLRLNIEECCIFDEKRPFTLSYCIDEHILTQNITIKNLLIIYETYVIFIYLFILLPIQIEYSFCHLRYSILSFFLLISYFINYDSIKILNYFWMIFSSIFQSYGMLRMILIAITFIR